MTADEYDPYAVRRPDRERVGRALRPDAGVDGDDAGGASGPQAVAAGQLRAFIERVERVEEEISALQDDRKEIFAEAKATGFDVKAVRTLIRLRKKDEAERQEEEAILDLYKSALGMA